LGKKSKNELKGTLGVILSIIVVFIAFKNFRSFDRDSRSGEPCKNIEASAPSRVIKADSGVTVSKEEPRDKNADGGQKESADNSPKQEADIADNDESDQEKSDLAENDESDQNESDLADSDEFDLDEFDIADNNESDDDRWMMRGRRINSSQEG
jgi:hypothetical protein